MKPLADLVPLVEQVSAAHGAFVEGLRSFVHGASLGDEVCASLATGLSSADEVLRREPPDWEALDSLLAAARYSTTTMGILLALGASWVRGGDASQAVSRLVAALTHQFPPVRDQARAILQQAAVEGLAATYQEIISGTQAVPCSICRCLPDETWWGEEGLVNTATMPEPPQFKQLTRLNEEEYRCPQCGTCYALQEGGGDFVSMEWTHWTLTRMEGPQTVGRDQEA